MFQSLHWLLGFFFVHLLLLTKHLLICEKTKIPLKYKKFSGSSFFLWFSRSTVLSYQPVFGTIALWNLISYTLQIQYQGNELVRYLGIVLVKNSANFLEKFSMFRQLGFKCLSFVFCYACFVMYGTLFMNNHRQIDKLK